VLLGWSPQIFQIVSELVIANQSRRRASIAILARTGQGGDGGRDQARVENTYTTRIICRSGSPIT